MYRQHRKGKCYQMRYLQSSASWSEFCILGVASQLLQCATNARSMLVSGGCPVLKFHCEGSRAFTCISTCTPKNFDLPSPAASPRLPWICKAKNIHCWVRLLHRCRSDQCRCRSDHTPMLSDLWFKWQLGQQPFGAKTLRWVNIDWVLFSISLYLPPPLFGSAYGHYLGPPVATPNLMKMATCWTQIGEGGWHPMVRGGSHLSKCYPQLEHWQSSVKHQSTYWYVYQCVNQCHVNQCEKLLSCNNNTTSNYYISTELR